MLVAVHLFLLLAADQIGTSAGQSWNPNCHIPAGQSALAAEGRDAIRFHFSSIENNVNYILPNVNVLDHVYVVRNCGLSVYLVSQTIQNPSPFLENAGIENTLFFCAIDTDPLVNRVYGVVLRMIGDPPRRPEVIPTSWYNSPNIILQLNFYRGFPANPSTTYRCKLEKNVTVFSSHIHVLVTANFSVQKVGCPKSHWGYDCSSSCYSCENGGQCDTFDGRCYCLDGFTGTRCETRITTHTRKPSTTTGTTRSGELTLKDNSTTISPGITSGRQSPTSSKQTTSAKQTTPAPQTTSIRQTISKQQTASANQKTSGQLGLQSTNITQTLTLIYFCRLLVCALHYINCKY